MRPAKQRTVVVVLVVVGSLWAASTVLAQSQEPSPSPSPSPQYYVDGARPDDSAAGTFTEAPSGGIPKGCVPWSPERPDVAVCGTVPPGWEPPAPPGDASTYPEVCAAAAELFATKSPDLILRYELEGVPRLDVSTCTAAGIGSGMEGRWLVRFNLVNPDEVAGYAVVKIWNFRLDPAAWAASGVTLSTS